MNESIDRLVRLCDSWPRVAIGSCEEYDVRSPSKALARLREALAHVVDENGYPVAKLHGLRMLNGKIFSQVPLSSADSTNIAQNIGKDKNWRGTYQPMTKETRAMVMAERIEWVNSAGSLPVDTHPLI